jgi:SAM-dependent methyltransferase
MAREQLLTGASPVEPPLPPPEIAAWSGVDPDDPLGSYDRLGRANRELILGLLPEGWSFEGKRVLDFGCGSGKVLRHFLIEAESCEFHGCDLHGPSIRWLGEHLSPPVTAFINPAAPPVPRPDAYFDLIWAISVFTHIADGWSAWLLELHRLLADGGLLIATFLGRGMSEVITGEPWDDDRIGMNVVGYGRSWEDGNPSVLHSRWWIEVHWGRAFEIVRFLEEPPGHHGFVVLRKRDAQLTVEDLERPEPGEPRELESQRHYVRQLQDQIRALRSEHDVLRAQERAARSERDKLQAKARSYADSRSWRSTRPLRAVARRLARRR